MRSSGPGQRLGVLGEMVWAPQPARALRAPTVWMREVLPVRQHLMLSQRDNT